MNVLRGLAASCALLGGVACTSMSAGPAGSVHIYDTTLEKAQANRATVMTAERAPLQLDSGATVTTCSDYLNQPGETDWTAIPDNVAALPDYVICDSLAVLESAQPVPVTSAVWGEALSRQLDFRSFRSSRYQQTSDEHFTLNQLADEPLQIDDYSAALDTSEWFLQVRLVAVGDFNDDGRADGLLWLTDRAKQGTYVSVQALVVDDIAADGPLEARPVR